MEKVPSPPPLRRLVVSIPSELVDALSSCLMDAGAGGIEEGMGQLTCYPQSEEQTEDFERVISLFVERSEDLEARDVVVKLDLIENDFHSTWLKALEPVQISSRFILRPTHCAPASPGEESIWFEPEASFGSGEHVTTRLASQFVEDFISLSPGASCLDVGTGTGVLSLVAARCGASNIIAVDCDDVAVSSAQVNLKLNQVEERVQIRKGSADSIVGQFDLVLANINTNILREIATPLAARLKDRGTLMLTGLLQEDIQELTALYFALGLRKTKEIHLEGWSLLLFQRSKLGS